VGLAGERRAGHHELPGDDALTDDLLRVVDVVHEAVERPDPLREPALDHRPLVGWQDARDEVEREGAVPGGTAVGPRGVEGDPLLDEDRVAALGGGAEPLTPEAPEHGGERGGRGAGHALGIE
jgi:hypothetical protein